MLQSVGPAVKQGDSITVVHSTLVPGARQCAVQPDSDLCCFDLLNAFKMFHLTDRCFIDLPARVSFCVCVRVYLSSGDRPAASTSRFIVSFFPLTRSLSTDLTI